MTALAEERNFSHQEFGMVASVDFMTVQAVFLDGGMFKSVRPPLFGVAGIAEVVDRIRLHHPWSKASMDLMTVGAFYPALFHRMMGLFVLLSPDILVACITDIGLLGLQGFIRSSMNRMAVIARDACGLVLADVPGSHVF
jgi:hypothetical protein